MSRWEIEDHFDRLSGARTFSGLVDFLNEYIREYGSSAFMNFENDALNVMINCDEKDKEWLLNVNNTVRKDQIRFGTGGNLLDWMAPHSYNLNTTEFFGNLLYSQTHLWDYYR